MSKICKVCKVFGENIKALSFDSSINSISGKLMINSSGEPLRFKKHNNTLVICSKSNLDIKQYLKNKQAISSDNVSNSNDYSFDNFEPIQIEEYSTAIIVVPGALGSELFYQNNKIFGPNLYTIEQNKTNAINLMNLLNNMFSKLYLNRIIDIQTGQINQFISLVLQNQLFSQLQIKLLLLIHTYNT